MTTTLQELIINQMRQWLTDGAVIESNDKRKPVLTPTPDGGVNFNLKVKLRTYAEPEEVGTIKPKTLPEEIASAIGGFMERSAGSAPSKLLLGKNQWEIFRTLCEPFHLKQQTHLYGQRAEFRGLKIYVVDDESFVGVA